MADTNLLVLAKEFSKLRSDVKEVLKMPVGPEGKQGERGLPGKDGKDGLNGRDGIGIQGPPGAPGRDGRDGKDGKDGIDGQDGVSVTNAYIDFDGSLVIELSDGNQIDAGFVSVESRDNIVQQLKNGALSLNELLPSQTGNANKYLKTDGENTSWDTLTGSDIDLSSPGPIGSTTPAAATFTTLTATGQTSLGGSAGGEGLRVTTTASANRYVQVAGGVFGASSPTIGAAGGASGLSVYANGGSPISFLTNGAGGQQLSIAHTASAVNYVQVTGSATGSIPIISAQGSDANVPIYVSSKGTSPIRLATNGVAQTQVIIRHTASSVNNLAMTGSVANAAPVISSEGTDTNIDLALTPKGTGTVIVNGPLTATGQTSLGGAAGSEAFRAVTTASSSARLQATGGVVTSGYGSVEFGAASNTGTDTLSINYTVQSLGQHLFKTGSGKLTQLAVSGTASAVNYVQVTGGATGGAPSITTQGSDTNVQMNILAKGTGAVVIGNNTRAAAQLTTSGLNTVNYFQLAAAVANSAPVLSAVGTDTNIDLALTPKGTGLVRFGTYTAGAPTATGYISIKAADGTTYKVLVGT